MFLLGIFSAVWCTYKYFLQQDGVCVSLMSYIEHDQALTMLRNKLFK